MSYNSEHVKTFHRCHDKSRWPCVSHPCSGAKLDFSLKKDLRRHLEDKHCDFKCTCSCGHRSRKDKHLEHLRAQQCKNGRPYMYRCGYTTDSDKARGLHVHQHHVSQCQDQRPRRRGRPRKTPITRSESVPRQTGLQA